MLKMFLEKLPCLNPIQDYSHSHQQLALEQEEKALNKNQHLIEQMDKFQTELAAHYQSIKDKNPQLLDLLETLNQQTQLPGIEQPSSNQIAQKISLLSKTVLFLEAEQSLDTLQESLLMLQSSNRQILEDIDSLEQNLSQLDDYLEKYQQELETKTRSLNDLVQMNMELAKK